MTESLCDLLDGFLGRWLTDSERAAFQDHLAGCAGCRQHVAEQEQLNGWLQAATAQLVPTPPGLIPRIERQRKRAQRRRRAIGWAAGIAAVLLVGGLSVWWLRPRPAEEAPSHTPIAEAPPPAPPEPASPPVRVTFAQADSVIAVPRKTDNPAVTILWVYPAVPTMSRGLSQPHERTSP